MAHTCIDAGSVTNTSGVAISLVGALHNNRVDDTQINGECVSLDISGTGAGQNIENYARYNTIIPSGHTGCVAIRLGKDRQRLTLAKRNLSVIKSIATMRLLLGFRYSIQVALMYPTPRRYARKYGTRYSRT